MEATFITQLIIAIGLSIFSLVFFLMKRLYPQKQFPELVPRLKTWWGMFIIFSIAVFFDPIVSLISLAVLCFFSLKEFFSMMKTRKIDRQLFLWVYLSIPIQFYWIYTDWYGMFIIFIPIYVFLFMPLPRIFSKSTIGFLRSLGSIQWGLMLMVFGLSHLAYYQVASPEYGANLVLFLVLLTQVSDLIQYLVSKTFGKRKVIPTSNPLITWEGLFLSVIATTTIAYFLYPYLTPLTLTFGLISGVLISVTGFFGSLTVSVLKRDLLIGERPAAEIKSESYLSRIDSLTYTAPIFFHTIRYFFDFM